MQAAPNPTLAWPSAMTSVAPPLPVPSPSQPPRPPTAHRTRGSLYQCARDSCSGVRRRTLGGGELRCCAEGSRCQWEGSCAPCLADDGVRSAAVMFGGRWVGAVPRDGCYLSTSLGRNRVLMIIACWLAREEARSRVLRASSIIVTLALPIPTYLRD
jgi:hypothetical protein